MTFEDQARLADLLEQYIEAETPMIRQLEKMGPSVAPRVAQEKQRMGAAVLLLTHLRSGEHQTLSRDRNPSREDD